MDRLEDQFVAGSWAPPFVAPYRKKRKLLNKKQTTAATKTTHQRKKTRVSHYIIKKSSFTLKLPLDNILVMTNASAEVETITSSNKSAPNTTTLIHSTALSNYSISSSTVSDLLASSSHSVSTASDLLASSSHSVSTASDLLASSSYSLSTVSDLLASSSHSVSTASDLLASSSHSVSTASDLLASSSYSLSTASDLLARTCHPVSTVSDLLATSSHPVSTASDLVSTSSHLVGTVSDLHSLLVTDIPTCSTTSNSSSGNLSHPSNHDQSPLLSVQSNHQPTQMSTNLDLGNNCVTTTQLFCPINNFLTMSSFPHNPSADLLELSSDGISPVSSFSTSGQNITITSHSLQSPVQSTHAESSNNEVLDPDNVLDALGNIDDLYGWDSNILSSASPESMHVTKPLII